MSSGRFSIKWMMFGVALAALLFGLARRLIEFGVTPPQLLAAVIYLAPGWTVPVGLFLKPKTAGRIALTALGAAVMITILTFATCEEFVILVILLVTWWITMWVGAGYLASLVAHMTDAAIQGAKPRPARRSDSLP